MTNVSLIAGGVHNHRQQMYVVSPRKCKYWRSACLTTRMWNSPYSITMVSERGRLALFALLLFSTSEPVRPSVLWLLEGPAASSPIITQSSSSSLSSFSFRLVPLWTLSSPDGAPSDWVPELPGINAAILDSLKLKYPEDSKVDCPLLWELAAQTGVKPVLVILAFDVLETLELFDKFLTGEFLMGDWVRPFVGVMEPRVGVKDPMLSLELLLASDERFILRRCASGAFVTSCRRNPSRWALWKASMVTVSCVFTLNMDVALWPSTSGVTRGVTQLDFDAVRIQSLFFSSSVVSLCFGSTVSKPERCNFKLQPCMLWCCCAASIFVCNIAN